MMKNKNVFIWDNALFDYINPINTISPIVELPEKLNPYRDVGVRIFAKLLNTLPLTNVKSIPAFSMLSTSNLTGIHTIVENSSGNTAFSLAVIARLLWVQATKAFVSNEITPWKLKMLRLFWVHPIVNKEPICPDPSDKTSGIYKAIELWQQEWWYNPGQYNNINNPNAHYQITWPQIYDQMEGDIQIFCAWLWTTGTMTGISKYLKEKNTTLLCLWVIRKPNNPIPWPRTKSLLSQIAFDWNTYVDETIEIWTKLSYSKSLDMLRYGLVVWPSSWFVLAWVLDFIEQQKAQNTLDRYRNDTGEINVVFICCDTPFPYIDEYFTYLDDDQFPQIQNKELLLDMVQSSWNTFHDSLIEYELLSEDVLKQVYDDPQEQIQSQIEQDISVNLKSDWVIYDIRTSEEFSHFHIPWSQNIQESQLINPPKDTNILIVCRYGLRSFDFVSVLRNQWCRAYSLVWWITAWSDKWYPRRKPKTCFTSIKKS